MVRAYKQETDRQRSMIMKADLTERRLLFIISPGHCQTNLNWPTKETSVRGSGRQFTPLGQGG